MAYESNNSVFAFSLPAAADYSVNGQYCGVVLNTSGQWVLAGVGVQPHGFLDNNPKAGELARVNITGFVQKVKVGTGGVSVGVPCCVDAAGKVIGGATGNQFVGIPLETGVVNQIVSMLRIPDLGAHA